MTTTSEDLHDVHPARQQLSLALAVLVTLPGIVVRVFDIHLGHPVEATLFGLAIVGSAFMLSWAAEVAQLDISAGLAIAVLAFIAVLPEYAVDMVFAWKAGHAVVAHGPACNAPDAVVASPCSLALANMTGANRLLIGVGWSMVVLIAWFRYRQRREPFEAVHLERANSIELTFLGMATLYSMTLPFKSTINLLDALVLVGIFVAYTVRIATAPAEEPHLVGPARYIGTFSVKARRGSVLGLFFFAATVILLLAEHFAEALVATGLALGVSEFLLVQWLAPLASEAPELLVAGLYAWRLNTAAGLGTLVSSKVNQWTLLVGTLPIVFSLASGGLHGLPVDEHQREELMLTASQSVFAVATLVSLSISTTEALGLFGLFWAQFLLGAVVSHEWAGIERIGVSIGYLLLAGWIVARDRGLLPTLVRDGLRTPHHVLRAEE